MAYPKKDILFKYKPQIVIQDDGIHYDKWVNDLEAPAEKCYFIVITDTKDYISILRDVQSSGHNYFIFGEEGNNSIVFLWALL